MMRRIKRRIPKRRGLSFAILAINGLYQRTIRRLSAIRRERDTLRAELAALTKAKEQAERENRVLARMVEDMALDLANHDAGHPYHRGASLVEQRIDCYHRDAEAELKGADHA